MKTAALFLSVAIFSVTASLRADVYLAPGHPDSLALLPPPPSVSPPEQAAEQDESRRIYQNRTLADWELAKAEVNLTIFAFAPVIGTWFQPGKFPKTEALFREVENETKQITNLPKDKWKRLRPYQIDSSIVPVAPEKSFSYPSGHSTRGTVYAALLAEIFPEKREAILATGRAIGWHRVIAGDHFPTDVFAGRVLGQAIARELLASKKFDDDLAGASAELHAAALP